MPTLGAIVNQSAMLADVSMKFLTPPNMPNIKSEKSILAGKPFETLDEMVKKEFSAQPTLTNLLNNYTENKDNFGLALKENLDSLKNAADRLKDLMDAKEAEKKENATGVLEELAIDSDDEDNDENTGSALSTLKGFAEENIPPEQRNLAGIPQVPEDDESKDSDSTEQPTPPEPPMQETEETVKPIRTLKDFAEVYLSAEQNTEETVQNADEDSRVTDVKNLIRDFNSMLTYLNKNRGMSNLMSALADNFGNNKDLTKSLEDIGVSVDAEGFLSLNESILNSALERDADEVSSVLGSEGLAGQLDRSINLANYQGDRLFTSVLEYLNQKVQDDAESLYANNANYAKENTPRFFAVST